MAEIYENNIWQKTGQVLSKSVSGTRSQTAGEYGVIYIARQPVEVSWVAESHTVAGSDGGAVTLNIEKLTSGVALGAGEDILATAFDLKSTADTPVTKKGRDLVLSKARQLKEGERLAMVLTGTPTDLEDVNISVYFKPLGNGDYR